MSKQKSTSWIIGAWVTCPYCKLPRFYKGSHKAGDKILCSNGKAVCGKVFVLR